MHNSSCTGSLSSASSMDSDRTATTPITMPRMRVKSAALGGLYGYGSSVVDHYPRQSRLEKTIDTLAGGLSDIRRSCRRTSTRHSLRHGRPSSSVHSVGTSIGMIEPFGNLPLRTSYSQRCPPALQQSSTDSTRYQAQHAGRVRQSSLPITFEVAPTLSGGANSLNTDSLPLFLTFSTNFNERARASSLPLIKVQDFGLTDTREVRARHKASRSLGAEAGSSAAMSIPTSQPESIHTVREGSEIVCGNTDEEEDLVTAVSPLNLDAEQQSSLAEPQIAHSSPIIHQSNARAPVIHVSQDSHLVAWTPSQQPLLDPNHQPPSLTSSTAAVAGNLVQLPRGHRHNTAWLGVPDSDNAQDWLSAAENQFSRMPGAGYRSDFREGVPLR